MTRLVYQDVTSMLTMPVKRTATAVAVLLAALAMTACGSSQAPSAKQSAVPSPAVAQVQDATPEPSASESLAVAVGLSQHVDAGTMRVSRVEPGSTAGTWKAIIEVSTSHLVMFDGTYTATDSAGVEHVGTSALNPGRANGYGGWFVTFTAPDVATVTYDSTAPDQAPVSWSVG